jgi:hypothetical protein
MGKMSKALAGGFAAAVVNVAMPILMGALPASITSAPQFATSLEYLLYTVLVGGAVWAAPKNAA